MADFGWNHPRGRELAFFGTPPEVLVPESIAKGSSGKSFEH